MARFGCWRPGTAGASSGCGRAANAGIPLNIRMADKQFTNVEELAVAQPCQRAGCADQQRPSRDQDVAEHPVWKHTLAPEEIRENRGAADQRKQSIDVEEGSGQPHSSAQR